MLWKKYLLFYIITAILQRVVFWLDNNINFKPIRVSLKRRFLIKKYIKMENNFLNNLEKLCKQPGVSEYEKESGISTFLLKLVKNINPNTNIDSVGNIVSIIEGSGKTILLEAHMDETGFLVNKINEDIILSPQGIIRGEKVSENNVFVVGKNIKGKITISPNNDFIFTPQNETDSEKIKVDDIVAFERSFVKNDREIKASALDNRIGCSVLIELLSNVIKKKNQNKLIFIFSAKEEVDKSYFKEIIDSYKNAFAIVVDAAYAQPVEFDVNAPDVSIPVLGSGCAVQTKGKGFVVLEKDIENIKKIAKENGIKIQEERAPDGFGKTNLAKMLKQGIKSGVVINVPVRDQHHQFATTNISDAIEAINLIVNLI